MSITPSFALFNAWAWIITPKPCVDGPSLSNGGGAAAIDAASSGAQLTTASSALSAKSRFTSTAETTHTGSSIVFIGSCCMRSESRSCSGMCCTRLKRLLSEAA